MKSGYHFIGILTLCTCLATPAFAAEEADTTKIPAEAGSSSQMPRDESKGPMYDGKGPMHDRKSPMRDGKGPMHDGSPMHDGKKTGT